MSFRRADRHVVDLLSTANDDTFDLIYRKNHLEEIDDKVVQDRLAAAHALADKKVSGYDRLRKIIYSRSGEDHSAELTELVATIEIGPKHDAGVRLIHEARKRYEQAVAQGLLNDYLRNESCFMVRTSWRRQGSSWNPTRLWKWSPPSKSARTALSRPPRRC